MKNSLIVALASVSLLGSFCAFAQPAADSYPSRLIKFVVPYPPGSALDLVGRVIAERLSTSLKQATIVENRPGMATLLGGAYVAKSPPDGHTLMLGTNSTFAISPLLYKNSPVDPTKDFTLISRLGAVNFFLVTNSTLPSRTVDELVDLVKRNPGKHSYASAGNGSAHHLFMEVFKSRLGLDIRHIPYKGSALALPDLFSGQVEMMFLDGSLAMPNIRSGKLAGLGTSMASKATLLPSVPPIANSVPNFDLAGWIAVAGPAGIPPPIVGRIEAVLRTYLETPEYRAVLAKAAIEPISPMTPEELNRFVKDELARWAQVIKQSGASADD